MERGMDTFYLMPGCCIDVVQRVMRDQLRVVAHSRERQARCLDCGQFGSSVHSRYRRSPADLPSLGCQAHLHWQVRRFYCRNPACARTTFAERLPGLLAPRARRTRRLAAAQSAVAVELGGDAGARLLERLAMPTKYRVRD